MLMSNLIRFHSVRFDQKGSYMSETFQNYSLIQDFEADFHLCYDIC